MPSINVSRPGRRGRNNKPIKGLFLLSDVASSLAKERAAEATASLYRAIFSTTASRDRKLARRTPGAVLSVMFSLVAAALV